eukprot:m.21881 g.21881  ORF g.21881 m.21881 type:complete len:361 (+) comp5400_c0_seq1:1579-2661(+)
MNRTKNGVYVRLGKIGEGTYGQVYKAQDKRNFNIVAVKSISLNSEEEGIPSNAVREISLLKQLRHPNIVRLLDVLYSQQRLSLVFEYCEQDLSQYISGCRGHPDTNVVQSLLYQMLRGVSYCHQHMILHRDLKPQNILLDKHMRLKIADFGLARPFGIPVASYSHEVVTLWYRAPDVLLGSVYYDAAIDMWSVGCIFAELMLTVPLFRGSTVQSQLVEIVKQLGAPNADAWPALPSYPHFTSYSSLFDIGTNDGPVKLRDRFSRAPPHVLDLLEKMLQYAPENRITAADALQHQYFDRLTQAIQKKKDDSRQEKKLLHHAYTRKTASYQKTPEEAAHSDDMETGVDEKDDNTGGETNHLA